MIRRRLYKTTHDDNELFYNIEQLLSHGADISTAESIRDLGKSYSMLNVSIKKATANGFNCVVMRWQISELKHVGEDMFQPDELHSKDNPEGIWMKSGVSEGTWFFERKDNGCRVWFVSLKASNSNKGLDIRNLKWVFFDEFIPESYDTQTRRIEEFKKFHSMYWTLKRNNEHMRVVMCCNCITWFNGYFEAWNIRPFNSGMICKQIIEEYIDGEKYTLTVAIENIKPTKAQIKRIAKNALVAGRYFDESYFNNLTEDNVGFIGKCPDPSVPLFEGQWVFQKKFYTFRYCNGLYWWIESSKREVPSYTTSKSDIGPDVIRDRQMGKTFDVLYDTGKMRFENGNIEQTVLSMIWAGRQNQI